MSQIIYNYPKSSCNCYKCVGKVNKNIDINKGNQTNMSVGGCKFSKYWDCFDEKVFNENIQPVNISSKYNFLNPKVITDKTAKEFMRIDCKDEKGCCPKIQYASTDPRLIAGINGQVLTLDRPPLDGQLTPKEIDYSEQLNNFGQNYKSYKDVNAGDVLYYTDDSVSNPFVSPVFDNAAAVESVLYQDPMNAMKPYYHRVPLVRDDPIGPERDVYSGCLSWIQDSNEQREDIMALQLSGQNRSKWSSRWAQI